MKRITKLVLLALAVVSFALTGCTSSPSRVNELPKDTDNLGLDIGLNGQLVKLDGKFTLGNFYVPSALPNQSKSISATRYTRSPVGPWEFNWKTLFPAPEIQRTRCIKKSNNVCRKDGTKPFCPAYPGNPFFRVVTNRSGSGDNYSERVSELNRVESGMTPGQLLVSIPVAAVMATYIVVHAPLMPHVIYCTNNEKSVEFDHDKFYDTVKTVIIAEYGSYKEFISDIQQVSIVYKRLKATLKATEDRVAKEVGNTIRVDASRTQQLTRDYYQASDNRQARGYYQVKDYYSDRDNYQAEDNYQLDYTIYRLDKIPRQADWETYQVTIENEIAAHYKEQVESIKTQLDARQEQSNRDMASMNRFNL